MLIDYGWALVVSLVVHLRYPNLRIPADEVGEEDVRLVDGDAVEDDDGRVRADDEDEEDEEGFFPYAFYRPYVIS